LVTTVQITEGIHNAKDQIGYSDTGQMLANWTDACIRKKTEVWLGQGRAPPK